MNIDHIYHEFSSIGGAEEHITSLAETQRAKGDDVGICLIRSVSPDNQYADRLSVASIGICQWPLWISRMTCDWDTREKILQRLLYLLSPITSTLALVLAVLPGRSKSPLQDSIDGRIRRIVGSILHPRNQEPMFRLLLGWRYLRRKPDVLHLHGYGSGLEFVLDWARTRSIRTVYQEHATPDNSKRSFYGLPTGLNKSSVVVAVSRTSAEGLRDLCGVTQRIEVVPPMVSVPMAVEGRSSDDATGGAVLQIVTVARLSREKGLDCLILAAKGVVDRQPHAQFLIYGDGELRDSLERQINDSGLAKNVSLLGSFSRSELPAIMGSVDIFVLPSRTEGLPLSVIEAMANGCPIVATAVGGIPELIVDGVNGLLCPPDDPECLAEKLSVLIDDPAKRRQLGQNALEAYSQGPYQPATLSARYSTIYRGILD